MILSQAKPKTKHFIHLLSKADADKLKGITPDERSFIGFRMKENVQVIPLFKNETLKIFSVLPNGSNVSDHLEQIRLLGNQVCQICNDLKIDDISVKSDIANDQAILAFCEGLALTNYQFNKYKTGKTKFATNSLMRVYLDKKKVTVSAVKEFNSLVKAVYFARDLVNEPLSYLTARQYSKDIQKAGRDHGFKVKVIHQKKIEEMKMGGIVAVNKGSVAPATFNILEHKPARPANKQPIVLVGKGVVYDTGGLSLKPTLNSMDYMKCDMAGSAIVVGAMIALAKNKVNLHVIGLVPAVENRPGGEAIVPGDVITMYDGTTVEVMNTDAEGRLILADALAYAKSLKPSLVLDFATLTGAASRAIGPHGIALMSVCDAELTNKLKLSGEETYERLVEFPLWNEFGEMLESPIADIKNLGGASAGMITAGKFLQHFTNYPWMHLDVAGVSYYKQAMNYRGINGTGTGVRLVYNFLKTLSTK